MRKLVSIAAILCAFMCLPALASAHGTGNCSSTQQAYSSVPCGITKIVNHPQGPNTPVKGSLPFTGLDIGALAGGAVLLLGSGLALRKYTKDHPDTVGLH